MGPSAQSITMPIGRTGVSLRVIMIIALFVRASLAAQFGNFTYTDTGSAIIITGYPNTATGAVTIPGTINGKPVKVIAPSAFNYCYRLTSVTFPASLTSIEASAFMGCSGLSTLTLPAGLTRIGRDAFRNCTGLTGTLTLPAGLSGLDYGAFASCGKITSVFIPAYLYGISEGAFSQCYGIQSISVDAGNAYYSSSNGVLFENFASILVMYPAGRSGAYTVPAHIKQIGNLAFEYCQKLTSLSLPSGVTRLGDDAFAGCSGLTSLTLPNTVTHIGARCFSGASKLRNLTLPSSVNTIGVFAFSGCHALERMTLPAGVTSLGAGPFAGCSTLTSIAVAAGNPKFAAVDGVLFDITKTQLVQFPSGRAGSYTVPAAVTEISDYAFKSSQELTAVRLPTNLETIAPGAFSYCSKLVDIPLPPHLTTIESNAFHFCQALEGIRIPSSVTTLGIGAFLYCTQLAYAEFRGDAPTMGSSMFTGTSSGFEVRYYHDKVGFTSPTWQGYPSVDLGDYVTQPPHLWLRDGGGNILQNLQGTALFDSVTLGGTSARTFTITNAGEADLTNIDLSITGSEAADFQVTPPDTTALWEGDSRPFLVTFRPTAPGRRMAKLTITSNAPDENPFEIQLDGTAMAPLAPEISVSQPIGTVLGAGDARNFGTVDVGGKSAGKTFTITNEGTAVLSDLVVTGNGMGDFTVSQPIMTALLPGTSTTFSVRFTPTRRGARTATLLLESNDGDEDPFEIRLQGNGAAPPTPEISVSQPVGSVLTDGIAKKSFGTVKLDRKSSAKVFTIANVGKVPLTGLVLSANGANAGDFKFDQPLKKSLAPGATTTFNVFFKPTAKGIRSAAIRLRSNDGNESPFDIKLTGMGVK